MTQGRQPGISAALLAAVVEATEQGLVLLDRDGLVTWHNRAAARLLAGRAPLAGRPLQVDPAGPVARKTLESLEELWNQRWTMGGYGRYHVSSEPDSPGPWPIASIFMARAYLEAGDDEPSLVLLRCHGGSSRGEVGARITVRQPSTVAARLWGLGNDRRQIQPVSKVLGEGSDSERSTRIPCVLLPLKNPPDSQQPRGHRASTLDRRRSRSPPVSRPASGTRP